MPLERNFESQTDGEDRKAALRRRTKASGVAANTEWMASRHGVDKCCLLLAGRTGTKVR